MTPPLTDQQIATIRELLKRATPAPFEVVYFDGGSDYCDILQVEEGLDDAPIVFAQWVEAKDAELIVELVNNAQQLLDEIVSLRAENAELKGVTPTH